MLVIPELEQELKLLSESKSTRKVRKHSVACKKIVPINEMLFVNWAQAISILSCT